MPRSSSPSVIERQFGDLGVAAKYHAMLLDMQKEVMPVKYYSCPLGWEEYRDVSKQALKDAGVMWVNKNGNFCLPPETPAPIITKKEDEEKEEEREVAALPPPPLSPRTSFARLQSEIETLNDSMRDTVTPDSAFVKDQARIRKKMAKAEKDAALDDLHQAEQRNRDLRELRRIMVKMPKYSTLSKAELKEQAEEYYRLAESCSPQVVDGQPETHDAHLKTCAKKDECQVAEDSCVPKKFLGDIEQSLPDDDESTVSTQSLQDLSTWWRTYYTNALNHNEENKTKKKETARSMLLAR